MEERIESNFEDDEDEFRSCCGDEEEIVKLGLTNVDDEVDEFSVRMFFKGVSISEPGNAGLGFSGIGVVMEGLEKAPVIQIQKKLEFFVVEEVADYLALMDGLSEAVKNKVKRVYAFTNSKILLDQITNKEIIKNPLLMALKQRILEYIENLEHFVLKCVLDVSTESPLRLAQVAIGVVHDAKGDQTFEKCFICCEDKLTLMTVTLKCSHKFCSCCMKAYVDEKLRLSEVPIKCPSQKCRYYISIPEHKSFLPVALYMLLENAHLEPKTLATNNFYCPFPNCSVLLDPSGTVDSTNNCVECPVCKRFICVKCGVSWHSSMSCDEFQKMDSGNVAFDCISEDRRWGRCQMCERMIEFTHGSFHMTCWCGHEFCYSCGAEYTNSQQTCECCMWGNENEDDKEEEEEAAAAEGNDDYTLTTASASDPVQQFEEWAWESFGSLSNMMDAYSDEERSQLALIQRFLAGGFSLAEPPPSPPPCADDDTCSYIDSTMNDLHQLPWLERFVSVISDNYYNEYAS